MPTSKKRPVKKAAARTARKTTTPRQPATLAHRMTKLENDLKTVSWLHAELSHLIKLAVAHQVRQLQQQMLQQQAAQQLAPNAQQLAQQLARFNGGQQQPAGPLGAFQ